MESPARRVDVLPRGVGFIQPGFVMSSINGIGSSSPVQKIVSQPIQKQIPTDPPAQLPVMDKVELSTQAVYLDSLKKNDIRADKVADIRAQIEAGTYETPDKLDSAIDKLLDDVV